MQKKTLFEKGAVEEVPLSQLKIVSRLFTISNKSVGLRPKINLRLLKNIAAKEKIQDRMFSKLKNSSNVKGSL